MEEGIYLFTCYNTFIIHLYIQKHYSRISNNHVTENQKRNLQGSLLSLLKVPYLVFTREIGEGVRTRVIVTRL